METLNHVVGLGAFALQIITLALLAVFFLQKRFPDLHSIAGHIERYGTWIGFKLSLLATLGALFYSDVLGFEPCPLCWWQRIFLFPQVILFAVALRKRDRKVAEYSIALSILGVVVALYQHVLQIMPEGTLPCPAVAAGCAQRIIFEFGYITFPLVSFSVFALLIVVMLFVRREPR